MSPTGIRPPYAPSIIAQFIRNGALPLLVAGAASTAIAQQQATTSATGQVVAGERLSAYLARQPKTENAYYAGLQWQVPQERVRQQALQQQLVLQAASFRRFPRLVTWLQRQSATGRVALGVPDERWLFANPSEDPVLQTGQSVVLPVRPNTVTVVLENGEICQVPHRAGALAWQYLAACTSRSDANQRDRAWITQPDGQQLTYGISLWNAEAQMPPAPGSWIWAPTRNSDIPEEFSERMAAYLATQGVATDGIGRTTAALTEDGETPTRRSRDLPVTSSDFGEIGLLQTPTSRMAEEGDIRFTLSRISPYTRATLMFQPLEWLEGGFRYADISDRPYGVVNPNQSYKDKSIDFKVRLWQESRWLPQLAVGVRDLGGTGLFSGEYVVSNKRTGNFDWSVGLGWGYLGARGNLSNPFSLLSDKFSTRPTTSGTGEASFSTFFRGRTSLFGGVQWHTPYEPLILKLEYDGNDYKSDRAGNPINASSPLNIGAVYRVNKYMDVSAAFERGNKIMLGVTFRNSLATAYTPKPFDPPPVPANVAPRDVSGTTKWNETAADLVEQTSWPVQAIAQQDKTLHVNVEDSGSTYRKERLERTIAVLNRDAPASVQYFAIDFTHHGLLLDTQRINRKDWVTRHVEAHYPTEFGNRGLPYSPWRMQGDVSELAIQNQREKDTQKPTPSKYTLTTPPVTPTAANSEQQVLWTGEEDRFRGGFTPSFWQSFGGPDTFLLYQVGVRASAEYRITPRTWLSGSANLRLIDNYDKFQYTAPSRLPRVRTYMREYAVTERLTLANLQLTHARQLTPNQFAMVYGGLLEPMFAGVGGEWLYRPVASRWAFGIDVNRVKQRDFEQRFSMRDYNVNTGHATFYWDTGWQGINASLSAGQYLAGDRGATVMLSKRFKNGVLLGAWATKTNVSAAQFGEGSFDKGMFVTIPFDLMLPKSTITNGTFLYTPLTRDGGAKLARSWQLYSMTSTRDASAFKYEPDMARQREIKPSETGQDYLWPSR